MNCDCICNCSNQLLKEIDSTKKEIHFWEYLCKPCIRGPLYYEYLENNAIRTEYVHYPKHLIYNVKESIDDPKSAI